MSGFMISLFYIAVLLTIVNGAIMSDIIERVCKLYGLGYNSRVNISLIVGLLISCANLGLVVFSRLLYNSVISAFLIQIGILVAYILLIKLVGKIEYKRNVKPYLQIKF